jgi:hypothetical protein
MYLNNEEVYNLACSAISWVSGGGCGEWTLTRVTLSGCVGDSAWMWCG